MFAFYCSSNGEKNLLNGAVKGEVLGLSVARICAPTAEVTPARPVAALIRTIQRHFYHLSSSTVHWYGQGDC